MKTPAFEKMADAFYDKINQAYLEISGVRFDALNQETPTKLDLKTVQIPA